MTRLTAEQRRFIRRTIIDISRRRQRPGTGSLVERERSARMQWPDVSSVLGDVPHAIVGAVATRAYMPEHGTAALDAAVIPADVARVEPLLAEAGYERRGRLAIGGSVWIAPDGIPVDVIEGYARWWPGALAEATATAVAGPPILPLHWLVLMKMEAGRARDLGDVSQMLGLASDSAVGRVRAVFAEHAPDMREDLESMIVAGKLEFDASSDEGE